MKFIENILSPYKSIGFPARATFSIVTLIIISISILYSQLTILKYKYSSPIITILFICSLLTYYIYNYNLSYIHKEYEKREKIIFRTKNKENRDFIFQEIKTPVQPKYLPDRYGFRDLNINPGYWSNQAFSNYYGIKSAKVIPLEL